MKLVIRQMKKICLNCEYFECCDDEGNFLEKGYCKLNRAGRVSRLYVEDDDTCGIFSKNKQREEDLKNGM